MLRRALTCLLVLALLAACGDPSGVATSVQPTLGNGSPLPVPTRTVLPTAVTGTFPLNAETISAALLSQGDLPPEWIKGDLYNQSPADYDGPTPELSMIQRLAEVGAKLTFGDVKVWLYKDAKTALAGYENRAALLQKNADQGVSAQLLQLGDKSSLLPATGDVKSILPHILLVRCRMLLEITVGGKGQEELAKTYASRLDERFKSSACTY